MKKHESKNSKPYTVLHGILKQKEPEPPQLLQAMFEQYHKTEKC